MTRTTVYRGINGPPRKNTIADSFHYDDDSQPATDGPVLEVELGSAIQSIDIGPGEPVDVFISGWPRDLDDDIPGPDYSKTYVVRENGEIVEEGELVTGRHSSVEIVVGNGRLSIPPGNHVELDVYGEEVDNED